MASPMSPDQLQLLIAGYVLGDLDPDEAAEFERLLAEDSAIAEEVARMQKALELSFVLPDVAPPDHLRSAILSAHDQLEHRPAARPRTSRRRTWERTIGAAAAVLIVALGINNYRLWQALRSTQTEVRPAETLTYTLQPKGSATPASAQVVVNPTTLEGVLTTQNLPPLPPEKTYVLWTVLKKDAPYTTDSKGAILTEVFEVDAQGNVSRSIALPKVYRASNAVAKVAVTIEDAAAPQKHEGAPVLITN